MVLEMYRLAMPNRLFVFVAIRNAERLDALGSALQNLGASTVGPQVYSFARSDISPDSIREALNSIEIEQGESIYILGAGDKGLDVHGIVAPRQGGEIVVQSQAGGATDT